MRTIDGNITEHIVFPTALSSAKVVSNSQTCHPRFPENQKREKDRALKSTTTNQTHAKPYYHKYHKVIFVISHSPPLENLPRNFCSLHNRCV